MDSYDIILLILSTFLGIFLILAIVTLVFIIRIVRKVQSLVDKAETAVQKADSLAASLESWIKPASIAQHIASFIKKRTK